MSGKGERVATSAKIASLQIRESVRKSRPRRQCVTKHKEQVTFRRLVSPLLWQEVCIRKKDKFDVQVTVNRDNFL